MRKHKDYLNPQLRKHYEDRVKSDERALKEIDKSEFHTVRAVDKKPIIRRKRKHEKILAERTAPKTRGVRKDKAWRRYKELKKELKNELMTKDDMHPVKTIDGGRVVADMAQARANAYQLVKRIESGQDAKIRELRNLARLFEPDNPTLGNAEFIRR